MKTTVEVTDEDILHGIAADCARCPVARAMSRAMGKPIYCGIDKWWTCDKTPDLRDLPDGVAGFITAFDNDGEVCPFSFEVET